MPYCPACRSEYEPWIAACADCGSVLVAELPPAPAPPPKPTMAPDDQWVYLTNVPNSILGNLLVNQLKDAGIPAWMRRGRGADIGEFTHNDFVQQDILVPGSQVREARQYIDSPPGSPYARDPLTGAEWQPLSPTLEAAEGPGPEPADGWQRLPSETDYLQQRSLRKLHGAGPYTGGDPFPARHFTGDADADDDEYGPPIISQR